MKQAAVTADGVLYAEAVRHLFGLGEERAVTGLRPLDRATASGAGADRVRPRAAAQARAAAG